MKADQPLGVTEGVRVSGLWRYPVKSLAGEPLEIAELTADGVAGDRIVHVRGRDGPLTGRTKPGLLTLPATTGPDGVPQVGGHRWDSAEATRLVADRAGAGAELAAYAGSERFDVLNLLVATDGAVRALGHEVRRLRPNLLLAGVGATAEAGWPGQALEIGDAVIGIHSLRRRCIVTTIHPDTGDQDLDVLRDIKRDFGGEIALNCWVIRPGTVRLGDPATLVPTDAQPERYGGWILGAPYD